MTHNPEIRSKTAWFSLLCNITGVLIPGAVSALFLLSYTGTWTSGFGSTIITLFFALAFAGLCTWHYIKIINTDRWKISNGTLAIRSFWGIKRALIKLDEITSWWEIKQNDRHARLYRLSIRVDKNDYHLVSAHYQNYYPLRAIVTSQKKRDFAAQTVWYECSIKKSAIFGFMGGAVFLSLGSAFMFGLNSSIGGDFEAFYTGGVALAIIGILTFSVGLYILQFTTERGELPKAPVEGLYGFIKNPVKGLKQGNLILAAVSFAFILLSCVLAPVVMRHLNNH